MLPEVQSQEIEGLDYGGEGCQVGDDEEHYKGSVVAFPDAVVEHGAMTREI